MQSDRPDFPMGNAEFVALIAMLFATIAFSTDAMLPALPQIVADLAPSTPERVPLILTAFIFGLGLGTFFTGPLSDAYGRKNIVYWGAALYIAGTVLAWASQSLEVMLAARVVQGLGAAGPRIVSLAIIRDLYSGRQMAKIMSFAMMVFVLVPAFAPAMGAVIISFSSWRGIFVSFIIFSAISALWMRVRLPETLAVEDRRPLQIGLLWKSVIEIFSNPLVRLSIAVQTLAMSILFATLMLVQPIFDQVYDRADSFPFWFGVIAFISGGSSLINALLVVRLGMQRIVTLTLGAQIILSGAMLFGGLGDLPEPIGFGFYIIWQVSLFFQAGLVLGNLSALAMEPMGHIAGMAASVIGAVSTVLAALIASPIGLMFEGKVDLLVTSVLALAAVGFVLMLRMGYVAKRHPAVHETSA
ncbi:MFS transporter [Sulfitobacter sp. CW3]|uniref:MFS transporter n=1 Tax=Sulfitobacter sp. CW3 TaxID=2861965 RepID=UPI001C5EF6F4|nr:MFS transporter [Sulfitobacter sp. CW3]MBW4960766.1 MFS transporter [Sulfitobacter sp. CW3]